MITENQEILPESLVNGGGLVGGMLLFILRKYLGYCGSFIILLASALCGILIATTWSLYQTLVKARQQAHQGISTPMSKLKK